MIDFSALDAACGADPNRALQSLYGKGNTVRALAGTGARPQEVYTPEPIVEALAVLWPEGVQCDPCSGPDSIIDAAIRYCVPGRQRTVKGKVQEYYEAQEGDTDGKVLPWCPPGSRRLQANRVSKSSSALSAHTGTPTAILRRSATG